MATTKAEFLADAIGKQNSTDRATHIARYLELRADDEAARARSAESALATAKETLARHETQLTTIAGQSFPNLALQAISTAAGTIGGYFLQVDKAAWAGWTLVGVGALVFICTGWRQAVNKKVPPAEAAK